MLSASRQEESSARLFRALDDRSVREVMRPVTQTASGWTTVAAFGPIADPVLLLGWDGTPNALLPPGAVFAVPPEAREHVQLRTLARPLAESTRVPTTARAADVIAGGLPVIVDDEAGHPIGWFGLDELKLAANRDPVLARSPR